MKTVQNVVMVQWKFCHITGRFFQLFLQLNFGGDGSFKLSAHFGDLCLHPVTVGNASFQQ